MVELTKTQMEMQKETTEKYAKKLSAKKELSEEFLCSTVFSPLELEEGEAGKFSITKDKLKKGEAMTVVSMRNWLMMGYKPLKIELPCKRIVHKLKEGDRLLMSDSPQEMFLQYPALEAAKGRVLTSGLGIGMFATMAAKKPEVTEVIVVEKEKDVIELCRPKNEKIKIVQMDIWNYLKVSEEKFDYIYIDIHYSTGCMEYKETVLPMRKLIEERFPGVPNYFWAEEEMATQYVEDWDEKIEKIEEELEEREKNGKKKV